MTRTQPLRDEHRALQPRIRRLREVAGRIGVAPTDQLRREVAEVHDFLSRHLLAHAAAEEVSIYPAVAEVVGAPEVTRTMSRDHAEIEERVRALGRARARLEGGEPDEGLGSELRELLYGLHALIEVHFLKEEEVYLPLLDERLSPERAERMFRELHEAAHRAA